MIDMATQVGDSTTVTGKRFSLTKEEMIFANSLAIRLGYNRAVIEELLQSLPDGEYETDFTFPHHHRYGMECEPHVRMFFNVTNPTTGEADPIPIDVALPFFNRICERQGINPFEKPQVPARAGK